ncbi:putative proteasome activator protein pa26 [Leptomonas pyrrhocoris]|uniref:Putative proteasome activator protein pa26 n=1 Tax=Leptomonas pyrrhocoris TaxID=157538 RepID=A0A0N0E024_LEPPY|nr:putative proteasome activator protein pa26 [Leptomonas pyrrhocoris]KPA85945.1 putative proteasome activator protein pa26 [Leptomonas pyrrhocoris]|eukprot:XP_015664384.1 putative proteasome activator protein pa26 [Leptomonas pyrrhocoris]
MPPKRAAMAQAIRDTFTEDSSLEVVDQWSSRAVADLEERARNAHAARAAILAASYTADAASTVPQSVIVSLREYQEHLHDIFRAAETVRTVIACRIPELKAEDNLGVEVQLAVLKMVDSLEGKAMGNGGDKEGGAPGVSGMYAAREYLTARGAAEDKILGKVGDDDKKSKSAAPSVLLELQQIDADALLKLELSATQVATSIRSFINAYALNWKKLIQPRSGSGDKSIS